MSGETVLLAGASGLVGGFVLDFLLEDDSIQSVIMLSRKASGKQHNKLKEVVVEYDRLDNFRDKLTADHYICTLGTTIKKAGSQEAFRKVDHDYPLALGRIAKDHHAKSFSIVTALGSNARSSIFYNRVKGEVQENLKALQLNALRIFQPSLILGDRSEKRSGEAIAQALSPVFNLFLHGPLRKYRGIKAKNIARTICLELKQDSPAVRIYESDEIQRIAVASS